MTLMPCSNAVARVTWQHMRVSDDFKIRLVFALLATQLGCGSNDSQEGSDAGGPAAGEVTVTLQTIGVGSISGAGFDCGTNCVQDIALDQEVTLTAEAGTGYRFGGWSGDCFSASITCVFTTSVDTTSITATFVEEVPPSGQSYYVDGSAADDLGDGSEAQPKKFIQSAVNLMSTAGGDVVTILPGLYDNELDAIIDPPAGTPTHYNIIRAQIPGSVVIAGVRDHEELSFHTNNNLYIDNYPNAGADPAYLQFEGLRFQSREGVKAVGGHHIKFLQTSFEQGPDGNEYVVSVGGSYLLFEDCFFFGAGGRQAFGLYEGDHIVVRRAVIRHDLGWRPDPDLEPQGVATIYNSNFVEFQDVLLLDSQSDPESGGGDWWYGGLTFATNGPSNTNNNVRGLIQLNVEGTFSIAGGGGDVNNLQIDDVVAAWTDPSVTAGTFIVVDDGSTKSLAVNRATVHGASSSVQLNFGGTYSLDLRNSIHHEIEGGVFFSADQTFTESHNNCYQPPLVEGYGSCEGTGSSAYDPRANGLVYLPRIEAGSMLQTAGENGGQVGAQVTHRIGLPGTLYGDPGFDEQTTTSLWPWPFEERIKQEMCTDVSVTRGFCTDDSALYGGPTTITSYVFEALGSACPGDICP